MYLFIPFILVSIYSFFYSLIFNTQIKKSFLIISLIITYFLYFFGKIGFLEFGNQILLFSSPFIILFIIKKRTSISSNHLKEVLFLTLAFLIIIFYTQGAFLYKYDDFSEYGIIPKLIFFENYLPIYIDYLDKGTHSKVNIISIYQYFFLKNSALEFQENSLLVVNNFFKILLIINLFSYINYSRLKYFIIFIIFYFLIYSLSTGFDRLYVDSIIALIIPNLF